MIEGAFVFDENFKLGRIVKVNDNVLTIRFLHGNSLQQRSVQKAIDTLQVLSKDHIMVLKACVPDKLKKKVEEDPVWAFTILIKSYKGSISSEIIEKELVTLVPDYEDWIREADKIIRRDTRFLRFVKPDGSIVYKLRENESVSSVLPADCKIIPPQSCIYIQSKKFSCSGMHHTLKTFSTFVPVRDVSGIHLIKVFVDYCYSCKEFYISDLEFTSKLGSYADGLLRFFQDPMGKMYGPNTAFSFMASYVSALKRAGYTVSTQENLSEKEGHNILDIVIQYGVLSISSVQGYLKYFISYHGKNPTMQNAIHCWKADLHYINREYSKPLTCFFESLK